MKEGWEVKKLSIISDIINGGTPKTNIKEYWGGHHLWITPKDLGKLSKRYVDNTERKITDLGLKKSSAKLIPMNSIILSTRAPIGHLAINKKEISTNQGCRGIIPRNNVDTTYLFYFLKKSIDLLNSLGTGTTFKELSSNSLSSIQIPIPPLPEQKRIVEILDKAFTAIDKAKENAEKNLQNSRELFESYLQGVFANPGEDWEEKKLGEGFRLKSGDGLTSKMMNPSGEFHVYGGNGIAGTHDKYNLDGDNIIIGRVGALCGIARHIIDKIWLTDNAFKVIDFKYEFDNSFLTYLLNYKNLRQLARQAAQPVISNSSLKELLLQFPKSIKQQKQIVAQLDSLSIETKHLESIFQKKLADLEELKKSVLQKAFEGGL